MLFGYEPVKLGQFGIRVRLPVARQREHRKEPVNVMLQMFGEFFYKKAGAQPVKAVAVMLIKKIIPGNCLLSEIVRVLHPERFSV